MALAAITHLLPIHIKFMTINVSKTNDEDEMKCHVNDI